MKFIRTVCLIFIVNFSSAQNSVFDIIADSDVHTIFESLLVISNVDELLKGTDFYTVLAPNDEAFENIYTEEQIDSLKMDEGLADLMHFHLIKNDTLDFNQMEPNITVFGKLILLFTDGSGNIKVLGGKKPVPNLQFNTDPIKANNGVVHFLTESIILLPTTSFLDFLGNSSFLLNAVQKLNYIDTFLNTTEKYTVFIPPLDSILNSELYQSGALENLETLDSFFSIHVIPGRHQIKDLFDGQKLTTFNNHQVSIHEESGNLFVNNTQIVSECTSTIAAAIYTDTFLDSNWTTSATILSHEEWSVFPNPARNFLHIECPSFHGKWNLLISNLNGEKVLESKYVGPSAMVNVGALPNGIYSLQFFDEVGVLGALKFVKIQ